MTPTLIILIAAFNIVSSLIMLVKGWVEQKIARRAQRRYDVTGQT